MDIKMEKVENRGGKRVGSGRKPVSDPLVPIYFSAKTSDVALFGGKYETRAVVEKHIKMKAKKLKKLNNGTEAVNKAAEN
jgi:hypothetical protein